MSDDYRALQAATRTAGGFNRFGGTAPEAPASRYILPQFEERTSYGTKVRDPYSKLFEDRIVFLGVQIDDTSADDIMAQLLVLESQDPERDITIYINSPGGSQTASDRHLRHDAVHQAADSDGVPGSGGVGRGRVAGRRIARQASCASQRAGHDSPASA